MFDGVILRLVETTQQDSKNNLYLFLDMETEAYLNKINSDFENTFIIYKHRSIIDKYIGLKPTRENFKLLFELLDKTKGEYFDLPVPKHN